MIKQLDSSSCNKKINTAKQSKYHKHYCGTLKSTQTRRQVIITSKEKENAGMAKNSRYKGQSVLKNQGAP